jgi:hypothetical protein
VTSCPGTIRPFDARTSLAAAMNRLVESHRTRATGATRTATTLSSSSLNSSGSSVVVRVHQPDGTPGTLKASTPPTRPSACLGGRSPSFAATGTDPDESPTRTTDTRPPSEDHGWVPVSICPMPTFGGGGEDGRPIRRGAEGTAGESAVA